MMIQSPDCCERPCPSPLVENIPGPQGPAGADGTDGTNGVNAFTTTTASFVMPAEGANVTIAVVDGSWMTVGENVVVGKFGDAAFGTFQVVQVVSAISITIKNIEDSGTGAYASNSPPTTVFPSGATISPSGIQGVTGTAPGGALLSANNLSDVADTATSRTNLGIGTSGTHAATDFFQVANNLSEGVGATKRTNLGLGTAAVLDAGVTNTKLPPIDTTFTNGDAVFATAAGLQTKSAANARLALGLSGLVGAYILAQNQQATTINGGSFTTGFQVVVPINTLVADSGGITALASNALLLPTGVYRVRAQVLGYKVGVFQAFLFNIDDAVIEFYGTNAFADSTTQNSATSFVEGRLTVTGGPKHYRLMGECGITQASSGFGLANGFGGTEVYASWEMEKET